MEELESPLSDLTPLEPRIGLVTHPDRTEASRPSAGSPLLPPARPSGLPPRPASPLGPGRAEAARPDPQPGNAPTARPTAHAPKAKPDARPMRVVLVAGGIAALSAIATAIVMPPSQPMANAPAAQAPGAAGQPAQIHYVQLQPGQSAPPGAKVVDATAPQPTTVVTVVNAPAQKPRIIKTTQSGKVVP